MAKTLVIVESPSKAKTINKYLGSAYTVVASVGHIKDLPKSKLGIDFDNGYLPQYITVKGKKDIVDNMKKLASTAKEVLIATDPDREGEAIAYHIQNVIADKTDKIKRVLFNEITKTGIAEAMKHPREVDRALFDAQQGRRVMDRIIGYEVSPFLWKAFIGKNAQSLSAGRVQSVALRLISEREDAIDRFQPIEYWNLWADFTTSTTEFPIHARLIAVDNNEFKNPEGSMQDMSEEMKTRFIPDSVTVTGYARDAQEKTYRISSLATREVRKTAPAPFITSSLQTAASSALRFNPKRTMGLAQKLYEGLELGEQGLTGLITYMRTDSTRTSDEARNIAIGYIEKAYGKEYVGPERKEKKSKNAQEAHECIRPTDPTLEPRMVRRFLDVQDKALGDLYELIWQRFIASQMAPAVLDQTTVEIESDNTGGSKYRFRASGSVIKFRGYMQLLDDTDKEEEKTNDDERRLPNGIQKDQTANLEAPQTQRSETKPPPRFSESSLVKELESLGIGRPSTYASIVGTIQDRLYVEQNERRLYPTELGRSVNRILVKSFPEIFNVNFTAQMEDELDTIATRERTYESVMNDFYIPFKNVLSQADERLSEEMPKFTCPACESAKVELKSGWFGFYLDCPDCGKKTSVKSIGKPPPEKLGEICPECKEGELLLRSSRFGKFIGCSRYPTCKYTRQIPTGIKCPKCTIGDIVQRKGGKAKRSFWGCARYPECDFISNDKPVNKTCPSCNNNWLATKWNKSTGNFLKCPQCKKEFTDELLEFSEKAAK